MEIVDILNEKCFMERSVDLLHELSAERGVRTKLNALSFWGVLSVFL